MLWALTHRGNAFLKVFDAETVFERNLHAKPWCNHHHGPLFLMPLACARKKKLDACRTFALHSQMKVQKIAPPKLHGSSAIGLPQTFHEMA